MPHSEEIAARLIAEATGSALEFCRWRQTAYSALAAIGRGATWILWDDGEPIATAGFYFHEEVGRFQEVVTAERHRRRVACGYLCAKLVEQHRRDGLVGDVVVVADVDGAAERVYRRLGFEQKTRQWCMISARPQ